MMAPRVGETGLNAPSHQTSVSVSVGSVGSQLAPGAQYGMTVDEGNRGASA